MAHVSAVAAAAAATAFSMGGSSGDVGRAASPSTCVLRWRNGLIAAAVVVLFCALQGVSAEEDDQLLVPEVVFEEPATSETMGIAYSPQSGVLYEVGTRSVLHPRQIKCTYCLVLLL